MASAVSPLENPAPRLRLQVRRRRAIILTHLFVIFLTGPIAIVSSGIRINLTESMPRGLYKVTTLTRVPRRGEIVAVCPSDLVAAQGRQRGYLGPGHCSGNVEPLLKIVLGLPGDVVAVTKLGILVNGQLVSDSRPAASDDFGRPLTPWPPGLYRIPTGTMWLFGHSRRSWDSRYWGPLPQRNIVGSATRMRV